MKETQKQQIERLQRELRKQKDLYNKLNSEVIEMQNNADNSFLNSGEYKQMTKRIEFLESQNKLLESKNNSLNDKVQKLNNEIQETQKRKEHYKSLYNTYLNLLEDEQKRTSQLEDTIKDIHIYNDVHKLNNEITKIYNERGAGRKTKFTDQQKAEIKMYRLQGKTIKELAEMFYCSVGLIHKLINENN